VLPVAVAVNDPMPSCVGCSTVAFGHAISGRRHSSGDPPIALIRALTSPSVWRPEKVIVNVGGDLDFNVRNSSAIQNSDLQWLPDLNIEFIVSKDRKLRAIVFNRNSLDINGGSLGKRNRQGVSISYRKDFDEIIW
jgi:hypothetical protein